MMKRLSITVMGLLLIGLALLGATCAQQSVRRRPVKPMGKASDWLKCSFGELKDGAITVNWEFRNISKEEVWIPIKFDVTEKSRPSTRLPFMFLVPGARLMSVAGLFAEYPDHIGIEEGYPVAELVRVAPGEAVTGKSSVILPFREKDVEDEMASGIIDRPNPFTPYGAGLDKVRIDGTKIKKIRSFQMAVQVYRFPKAVIADFKAEVPIANGLLVIGKYAPPEKVEGCDGSGKYWASCLTRVENREPHASDYAEWVVSPVYRVDWPVGSHSPVGLIKVFKGGLFDDGTGWPSAP